jgi:hypothetical protein
MGPHPHQRVHPSQSEPRARLNCHAGHRPTDQPTSRTASGCPPPLATARSANRQAVASDPTLLPDRVTQALPFQTPTAVTHKRLSADPGSGRSISVVVGVSARTTLTISASDRRGVRGVGGRLRRGPSPRVCCCQGYFQNESKCPAVVPVGAVVPASSAARSRLWRSAGRASRRSRRPALASARARGAGAIGVRLAPPHRDGSPDGSYGNTTDRR